MPSHSHTNGPLRVVIAGGGVAAIEAAISLRELAADRVSITIVSAQTEFSFKAWSTARPFAKGHSPEISLREIASDFDATLVHDTVFRVLPAAGLVRLGNGGSLEYDALIVAIGARPYKWSARGLTFGLERAGEGIHGLLADLELGYTKAVDFVVPPSTGWSLPVYELALMTAGDARAMGRDDIAVRVLTAEARPLAAFGEDASANVARVLSDGGVEVVCGVDVTAATDAPEHRVVTLPALHGPALEGLPHDAAGFHPVDAFCEVQGLASVFVVGDAADHPVKQGGLAAQQADVAARMIAARAGAHITPEPYKPVLRGMLLTDREPRFLRGGERAASSDRPLWWPTAKVAAPALARYLSLKGLIAN